MEWIVRSHGNSSHGDRRGSGGSAWNTYRILCNLRWNRRWRRSWLLFHLPAMVALVCPQMKSTAKKRVVFADMYLADGCQPWRNGPKLFHKFEVKSLEPLKTSWWQWFDARSLQISKSKTKPKWNRLTLVDLMWVPLWIFVPARPWRRTCFLDIVVCF